MSETANQARICFAGCPGQCKGSAVPISNGSCFTQCDQAGTEVCHYLFDEGVHTMVAIVIVFRSVVNLLFLVNIISAAYVFDLLIRTHVFSLVVDFIANLVARCRDIIFTTFMGHSVESYILPTIGPVFNRLKSLRVFWFDVLGDEIERTPSFMAGQRFEDFDIGELVEGSYCQDGMPFENYVH